MLRLNRCSAGASTGPGDRAAKLKGILLGSSQRGAVLIGIIIIMLIMAALGTGMFYMTTTSTYSELLSTSHAGAFSAAEAGGRYAMAQIRYALASNSPTTQSQILAALPGTYTMGSNSFTISALSSTVSLGTLTYTFSSTGTVGSGFMQASKQINYQVTPSMQISFGGGGSVPSGPVDFNNYPFTFSGGYGGGPSSQVNSVGTAGTTIDLRAASPAKFGIVTNPSFTFTGDYELQVKVDAQKAGTGSTADDYDVGLFFNGIPSTAAGYYLSIYQVNKSGQITFDTPIPTTTCSQPALLLFQILPSGDTDWIACASLNSNSLQGVGNWNSQLQSPPATLVVRVHRTNTPSNVFEVYFGSPGNNATPPKVGTGANGSPTDFNRYGYTQWTNATPPACSATQNAPCIAWPPYNGSWPSYTDYFTIASSYTPSTLNWILNTKVTTASQSADTTTLTGTSITGAVITSTAAMTGSTYDGIGLFVENTKDPWATFFDLAVNVISTPGTVALGGTGITIQYP